MTNPDTRAAYYYTTAISIVFLAAVTTNWQGSAQLHTVMEAVSTVLALTVGALALVRYYSKPDPIYLLVGVGFLGATFLDGYHAIVTSAYFKPFMPSDLPQLIPWSWVASRQFLSALIFLSGLAWLSRANVRAIYAGAAVFTLASFAFFAFAPLPPAYYPDLFFHRPEEFGPALFFGLALYGLLKKGTWRVSFFEHWLVLSLIICTISQAVFMSRSAGLFDYGFDVAHSLKIVGYICVLAGLLASTLVIFNRATDSVRELEFQRFALDQHSIVSITDVRGTIRYANDKFCEISGYHYDELIGQNHSLLRSDEHDRDFYKSLWGTIASGETWRGEIKNFKRNGEYYWVDCSIVPFMNDAGKPFQYVAIRTDITCQVNARQQAEAATNAKSEFLATMSHEIRTPMTAVLGFADILLNDDITPAAKDKVAKIKDAARQLLRIINDILDVSKLEAGKLEIEKIDVDLPALVEDVFTLFREKRTGWRKTKSEILLNTTLAADFPTHINSDPTRIRQIVVNLLANAIKFTETGSVKLVGTCGTSPDGRDYFRIAIHDTGIGMKPETVKKLFAEFTQADASFSRRFEGTGLGLSISKRLVELMGGEIGVESKLGEGSTFWFELPYSSAGKVNDSPVTAPHFRTRKPLHILVAEDNGLNQQVIAAVLDSFGHTYEVVENGLEAVSAHTARAFDLILMDVRMPEMDGCEATKMIRKLDGEKGDIPIIALTADAMEEHKRGYFEAGMDDVATKPIDRAELARTIDHVMGQEYSLPALVEPEEDGGDDSLDGAAFK